MINMNKIKVIKEYKGLQVNDILSFDKKQDMYVLDKVEDIVTGTTSERKTIRFTIGHWSAEELIGQGVLVYLDAAGNAIELHKISADHPSPIYSDTEPEKESLPTTELKEPIKDPRDIKIKELEDRIKELEKDSTDTFNLIKHGNSYRSVQYYSRPGYWPF